MGDYLDVVVKGCEWGMDYTNITLSPPETKLQFEGEVSYSLPFALGLAEGDKLSFYLGSVGKNGEEQSITHEDYVQVEILRGDELVARLSGEDLHILDHFHSRD